MRAKRILKITGITFGSVFALLIVGAIVGCQQKSTNSTTQQSRPTPTPAPINQAPPPTTPSAPSPSIAVGEPACPPSDKTLAGVYHPERLVVMDPCRRASGHVVASRREEDGDLHLNVVPDPSYKDLLGPGNFSQIGGSLVVELMPRDRGFLPDPAVGDQISVLGAWVIDKDHGWNELHPVWSVSLNGAPSQTSGPQNGGSPAIASSNDAESKCTRLSGEGCSGPSTSSGGSGPSTSTGDAPSSDTGSSPKATAPDVGSGSGSTVHCRDGTVSSSGGKRGACSHHGGEAP
jgi:hypothetical protein